MSPRSFTKKAAGHDVQDAISWHASALLMLFVFVILTSFGLALWMLKMYLMQQDLVAAVNVVAPMALTAGENARANAAQPIPKPQQLTLQKGSGISTLSYLKTDCQSNDPKICNDIAIFNPKAESTNFVVPSVRQVMAAAGLETIGWPEAMSNDLRFLTFRVGERYELEGGIPGKIVTVDSETGVVRLHPTNVDGCVTYSADGRYAADIKVVEKVGKQVVVHDLLNQKSKLVANASDNEAYSYTQYPDFQGCAGPSFVSATSVTFSVYPNEEGDVASMVKPKTIEFKF